MIRLAASLGTAALVAGVALVIPQAPAKAQGQIAEIVVYGDDPCPRSTDDQIVVCARKPEAERYRIPQEYYSPGSRQSREAWVNRAKSLETVSDTGTFSCSPVGPAGYTGCLDQVLKTWENVRTNEVNATVPPE